MPGLPYIGPAAKGAQAIVPRSKVDPALSGEMAQQDVIDQVASTVRSSYVTRTRLDLAASQMPSQSYVTSALAGRAPKTLLGAKNGIASLDARGNIPASQIKGGGGKWGGPHSPSSIELKDAWRRADGTRGDAEIVDFVVPPPPGGGVWRPLVFGYFEGFPTTKFYNNITGRPEVYVTANGYVAGFGIAPTHDQPWVWPIVVMPQGDRQGMTPSEMPGWTGPVTIKAFFRTAYSDTHVNMAGVRSLTIYSVPVGE